MTKRFLPQRVFTLRFAGAMLATGLCPAVEPTADFYVSPKGSDTWSGTLLEPNGPRTDGPFATLQRARDAVRESGKNRSVDVVVSIRGEIYRLNKTVVFGVQDTPTSDATITYAAYPGETPAFRSAQEVSAWKVSSDLPPGHHRQSEDRRGCALAHAKDADTDHNIYFCAGEPELGKQMLEKQQRNSVDTHSLAVDPLFVDADDGDFRLRPNSPALKLGFTPIDWSKVGLKTNEKSHTND